jgi:hypothetical protein
MKKTKRGEEKLGRNFSSPTSFLYNFHYTASFQTLNVKLLLKG